jgi:hypothetical protein
LDLIQLALALRPKKNCGLAAGFLLNVSGRSTVKMDEGFQNSKIKYAFFFLTVS